MPEPIILEELMHSWAGASPLTGHRRDTVATACAGLLPGAALPDALGACSELAMLFGDSGAPELCIVLSYRGIALADGLSDSEAEESETSRFLRHVLLALSDLGLSRPTDDQQRAEESPSPSEDDSSVWIRGFLAPVGGSLEAGAGFAARLAAVRAELVPRPDPLSLEAVRSLALPPR